MYIYIHICIKKQDKNSMMSWSTNFIITIITIYITIIYYYNICIHTYVTERNTDLHSFMGIRNRIYLEIFSMYNYL